MSPNRSAGYLCPTHNQSPNFKNIVFHCLSVDNSFKPATVLGPTRHQYLSVLTVFLHLALSYRYVIDQHPIQSGICKIKWYLNENET